MVHPSKVGKGEESVENRLLTCKWYSGLCDGPLVKKWLFWSGRFGKAMNTLFPEQTHRTIQTWGKKRPTMWLNRGCIFAKV